MDSRLEEVFEKVIARDGSQAEFHQAVHEVFESLAPVIAKHPEYLEQSILERIVEPERLPINTGLILFFLFFFK